MSDQWSPDRSNRRSESGGPTWLLVCATVFSLSCAQSDVLDLSVTDVDHDGSVTDPPGMTGAAGAGTVPETGAAGSGSGGGDVAGRDGNGGSTGGGSGVAGGTGGQNTGGAIGSGGDHGAGGASGGAGGRGAGGAAGHGSGGTSGHGSGGASGHGSGGTAGHGSGGTGGTAPTFATIYSNILVVYCAGSSCHKPGTQGGIGFSTQASAYSAISHQVIPGDGADSDLYVTVNTGVMPRGAPKLSAANLALIKAWIDAGAANN